jgi:hypothetical protein
MAPSCVSREHTALSRLQKARPAAALHLEHYLSTSHRARDLFCVDMPVVRAAMHGLAALSHTPFRAGIPTVRRL